MAPPKTMVINQQQQQQICQQHGDHQAATAAKQAKPRKRKAKQQPNDQADRNQSEQQQVDCKQTDVTHDQENLAPVAKAISFKQPTAAVPSERTTIKKQQQHQVPSIVKEPSSESKQVVPTVAVLTPTPIIVKHQQLASEEPDDIDAGIELDGSSNSGSSVKDMSEDQMKSTSVSPVMAQSSLVSETSVGSAKQAIEVAPIEQLTGSLCSTVSSAKKISTTKQQLAANQQVIDADEQLLQQKLQSKQRKSSSQDNNSNSPSLCSDDQQKVEDKKGEQVSQARSDKSNRVQRRFSSQSSQEIQDGSLCKVCQQHVYQMERMLAEKSVYHKRCFRCHQCKIQLRVDNYSSHEGQVYCKAHHRQIFQPQVKLDNEDDVDIVAKSTSQTVDDYLLQRGRLSELSFSFLQPNPEGIQKRQMIICENQPAELPKDVVRSNTKLDDGIEQLNLNLNNILEKFERGTTSNGEDSQPSSAGVVIEKPSFNIKQTLMAFESRLVNGPTGDESNESKRAGRAAERPVINRLTNLNGFLNRQNSHESNADQVIPPPARSLPVRRSESLMMRLKKYESRIAGEQVYDDDKVDSDDEDENNNGNNQEDSTSDLSQSEGDDGSSLVCNRKSKSKRTQVPKKLTSIDLSSLKNQWENGDINKRRNEEDENEKELNGSAVGDNNCNGNSPSVDKNEELFRIRQQLARKKLGESKSVKNIYENAIREQQAQLQQKQQASRRDSSDLSALNGFSTTDIQQQLLQNSLNGNGSINSQNTKTPTTPNKDHFQLNFSNKANKLKEKFELGLITNSSHDDSDLSDNDEAPAMTKLEQIRQEKLEDLSVFTDGEIKAREARSLFQQIDRRLSTATGYRQPTVNSRSLASIGASMRTKLTNQINSNGAATNELHNNSNSNNHHHHNNNKQQEQSERQPIRLTNNVKT